MIHEAGLSEVIEVVGVDWWPRLEVKPFNEIFVSKSFLEIEE